MKNSKKTFWEAESPLQTSDLVVGGGVEPPNCFLNPPALSTKFVWGVDSNPRSSLTQAIRSKRDSITE